MAIIKRRASHSAPPSTAHPGVKGPSELRLLAAQLGVDTSPLDVEKLAQCLNIRIRKIALEDSTSGFLKKENGKWVIGVNFFHHPKRQRFTIAHELAHFILHSQDGREFEDKALFRNDESNPMEWSANRFAGELLMPEDEFRNFSKTTSNRVEDLADHFKVSALAVRVRAKELKFTGHGL